jgi:hypothetical protein
MQLGGPYLIPLPKQGAELLLLIGYRRMPSQVTELPGSLSA